LCFIITFKAVGSVHDDTILVDELAAVLGAKMLPFMQVTELDEFADHPVDRFSASACLFGDVTLVNLQPAVGIGAASKKTHDSQVTVCNARVIKHVAGHYAVTGSHQRAS
jgi:hypothetical protein